MTEQTKQPKDTLDHGPRACAALDAAIRQAEAEAARHDDMAEVASDPDLKAGHLRTALTLRRLAAAGKEARSALRREPPA